MAGRRVIKGRRRSEVAAVTLLARCFLLLVGTVVYHQHGQEKYQEQLRAACAAKGGKLALSNLCINMKPMLDELTARYSLPSRPPIITITWDVLR